MREYIPPVSIVFPADAGYGSVLTDAVADLLADRVAGAYGKDDTERDDWLALFNDAAELARSIVAQSTGHTPTVTLRGDQSNIAMLAAYGFALVARLIADEAQTVAEKFGGTDLYDKLPSLMAMHATFVDAHARADGCLSDLPDVLPDDLQIPEIITLPLREEVAA
jgi:hypothetical protein